MIIGDLFKDSKTHKWALSKVILGLGFVIASVIMIKMSVLHDPEIGTCFLEYLCFITGHDNLRRFLDKKKDENVVKE